MDKFTLDSETVGSLMQLIADPTAAGNLGFLAGVLLVLMVIIAAFAVTTFVLGIVAVARAAKAGRACGFATPMAKASVPFGVLGIVAPIAMWRLSDTMCATGLLIAGFVCSIIAISSASNRMKAKASEKQAASAAAPAEAQSAADEPVAAEVCAESADDKVEVGSVDEDVADNDADDVDGEVPFDERVTDAFRVITPDEPTVRPIDPIEPAIEEESPSSVGDAQADASVDDKPGDMTDDEPEEAASDEGEPTDEPDEEEEPVEPMHKMTAAERAAQAAERDARRAAAAAVAAMKQARAMKLAAEDPEYAEYLAEQGRITGGLKKN